MRFIRRIHWSYGPLRSPQEKDKIEVIKREFMENVCANRAKYRLGSYRVTGSCVSVNSLSYEVSTCFKRSQERLCLLECTPTF